MKVEWECSVDPLTKAVSGNSGEILIVPQGDELRVGMRRTGHPHYCDISIPEHVVETLIEALKAEVTVVRRNRMLLEAEKMKGMMR